MSAHNIVIIGASFGGLPVAHGLFKDVLPKLSGDHSYKVTLISPTEDFFWKIGAPRTIAKPDGIPLDKALLNFLPTFSKYGDRFEFIKAYASSIETSTSTVVLSNGRHVHYDSLVIASGTSFESDLWSTSSGSEKVRAAYKEVHDKLSTATSVLIAGGGATGVETAGEFGENHGKTMDITLLSGSEALLNRLHNKAVGRDAQARLEGYGVKVVHNKIRVKNVQKENGKYTLTLSNGEVKTVDIYINATGEKPNSSFVPRSWLDEQQKVKTNSETLRLGVDGVEHVYVIGAVGSYSDGAFMDVKFAVKPLLYSMEVDLKGIESGLRKKNIFKKVESDTQFVPVGSTGGVGIAFGWRLPSFMIRMVKSKNYMLPNAAKLIEGTI